MKRISENFVKWIEENEGYTYYTRQLGNIMVCFEIEVRERMAYVYYEGYLLAVMKIVDHSIYLVRDYLGNFVSENVAQKKLFHEYEDTFHLNAPEERFPSDFNYSFTYQPTDGMYQLTQTNIYLLKSYLEKAIEKIEYFFDGYTQLLKNHNLYNHSAGYLKINVANSFSIDDLNDLLYSYNRLYSLIKCLFEKGYEATEKLNIEEVEASDTMILESIRIASSGFAIAVLSQVVATALCAIGKALIEGDRQKYEDAKKDVLLIISKEEPDSGARATELLKRWDDLLRLKESGRVPSNLIDFEICRLTDEIKRLQGIPSIDLLI